MYTTTNLSHTDAMRIISTIQAALEQHNQGGAVAVVDAHGELLAFLRTDGCKLPSLQIAINKAYTSARERTSSRNVGRSSREAAFPMTNFGELRYVTWGGGLPILRDGAVIGAVGVSGLTEDEDEALAQLGVDLFAGV